MSKNQLRLKNTKIQVSHFGWHNSESANRIHKHSVKRLFYASVRRLVESDCRKEHWMVQN